MSLFLVLINQAGLNTYIQTLRLCLYVILLQIYGVFFNYIFWNTMLSGKPSWWPHPPLFQWQTSRLWQVRVLATWKTQCHKMPKGEGGLHWPIDSIIHPKSFPLHVLVPSARFDVFSLSQLFYQEFHHVSHSNMFILLSTLPLALLVHLCHTNHNVL